MISNVMFVGRATAENCGPLPNWAVISIGEPDAKDGAPRLREGWAAVLSLSFHDVDPSKYKGTEYTLMTVDDAERIVGFVHEMAPKVEGILVHCRAGISRSAAVAKWIAEKFGLPHNQAYALYNRYVYQLIRDASQGPKEETIAN